MPVFSGVTAPSQTIFFFIRIKGAEHSTRACTSSPRAGNLAMENQSNRETYVFPQETERKGRSGLMVFYGFLWFSGRTTAFPQNSYKACFGIWLEKSYGFWLVLIPVSCRVTWVKNHQGNLKSCEVLDTCVCLKIGRPNYNDAISSFSSHAIWRCYIPFLDKPSRRYDVRKKPGKAAHLLLKHREKAARKHWGISSLNRAASPLVLNCNCSRDGIRRVNL